MDPGLEVEVEFLFEAPAKASGIPSSFSPIPGWLLEPLERRAAAAKASAAAAFRLCCLRFLSWSQSVISAIRMLGTPTPRDAARATMSDWERPPAAACCFCVSDDDDESSLFDDDDEPVFCGCEEEEDDLVLVLPDDEVVVVVLEEATLAVAQYPSYRASMLSASSGQLSTDLPQPALTHDEMYDVADEPYLVLQ